jgi:cytidylate kinase
MASFVITIDGPAASGKSTAARSLAERLGADFLDTGAMYRAVALAVLEQDCDPRDEAAVLAVIESGKFCFEPGPGGMRVLIDGADVTEKIRAPEVTRAAGDLAAARGVRKRLVEMQRLFAGSREKVVTEGRDQGTVVFPDADVKIYLTADARPRARRRWFELRDAGIGGETFEKVLEGILRRDLGDSSRSEGPLKVPEGAVVVDTTELTIEEMLARLEQIVREKCSRNS